jgi:hypothetical protein
MTRLVSRDASNTNTTNQPSIATIERQKIYIETLKTISNANKRQTQASLIFFQIQVQTITLKTNSRLINTNPSHPLYLHKQFIIFCFTEECSQQKTPATSLLSTHNTDQIDRQRTTHPSHTRQPLMTP